jgi:anaerobic sulfite reductase subunit C
MEPSQEAHKIPEEIKGYQVEICFGPRGCRNRAVDGAETIEEVIRCLRTRDLKAFLQKNMIGPLKRHHELRVAIADCPNACSRPQIADIGLIGACAPVVTDEACSRCGACVAACREGAITLAGGAPRLDADKCLNCGQCVAVCPTGALQTGRQGYRVLLGGKLGRHPRLATELPGIYRREEVPVILNRCLDYYMSHCCGEERLGDMMARDGEAILRELTT